LEREPDGGIRRHVSFEILQRPKKINIFVNQITGSGRTEMKYADIDRIYRTVPLDKIP
jgi:late competence protein required for DNA uptake (superfamily II DNA/RNA helicase)